MSTFLQLVQDLRAEVDIPGSGPSSVANQTGEAANLVRWIRRAYIELQNRNGGRWRWLRRTATVSTTADDDTYAYGDFTDATDAAVITRFKQWHINDANDPPKIYLTSTGVGGESWMIYTPWEWFKTIYKIGTQNSGQPVHITIDPNDQIVIGPAPNDDYTITLDYWMSGQDLTTTPSATAIDSRVPEMPGHFHQLLVYLAMTKYGYQQVAPEQLEWARIESRRMLRSLENEQLIGMTLGGPFA